MKCRYIESAPEKVPIECLHVAEIEDKAMPLRDRTLIHRRGIDQTEETVSLLTGFGEGLAKFRVRCHRPLV